MASGVTTPTGVNILPPTIGQAPPRTLPEFKQQVDVWTRKAQQILSGVHSSVTTLQQTDGGGGGYTHANFLADFAAETTDNLTQGVTNLYWSQALFNAAYAAAGGGSGMQFTLADFIADFNLVSGVTVSAASGIGISFATLFASAFAAETTTNLAEGTHLYFTNARAQAAISATSPITYASGVVGTKPLTKSVVLCAAYTPFVTGPDVAEVTIPYNGDGSSETFTITRLVFRVGAAGGSPQIQVELSTASGVFMPMTVGIVTLGSGANEGATTSGFTTATCASGNKLRFNILALGTNSANWCIQVEILPT